MHWYGGYGPGWAGMLFMTLATLAVVGTVVAFAVVALRRPTRDDDAVRTLELRLARGEIDEDEFDRLRRALGAR
ncbi:SHOCT domain-containing protein [Saccharothrix sp. NPDC042600]